IRRAIRAEMGRFRFCYEKALLKDPKLEGKVVAKFTIGAKGDVVEATAEGMPAIDACIAGVIKTIKFPAYGSAMVVSYPFAFAPR
ncbi:MAG: AgmX/PglI C-terminal domain-containing protein, partial [Myxococcales bacterium]|nr:AgmX/PglI C-terminal domain-containing protein [Myxococcales bacterium]